VSNQELFPQCEKCWIAENSRWEPEGVTDEGKLIAKLVAVAVPEMRLKGLEPETCIDCGDITVVGIYVEKEDYELIADDEHADVTFGDES
jgi:hypothetical protein